MVVGVAGDVDSGEIWTVNSRGLAVTIATAVLIACCVEGAIAQPPTDRMAQVSSQQPCDPLIDGTYCATQGGRLVEYGAIASQHGPHSKPRR